MSEHVSKPIAEFRNSLRLIEERIAGLTEAQIAWKPAPDKWSVKQIVAHLVDSSLVHAVRIRKIVAEPKPHFIYYNQDAWVESSRANEASVEDLLRAFEAILHHNALFYERLAEDDWERTGIDNGKEVSVSELIQGFLRHRDNHLAQIDRTKAALTAVQQV